MSMVDKTLMLGDELEQTYHPRLKRQFLDGYTFLVQEIEQGAARPGLPHSFRMDLTNTLTSLWTAAAQWTAEIVETDLLTKAADLRPEQVVSQYIDRYGAKQAAQIIRTTERQTIDMIAGGMRRGEAQEAAIQSFMQNIEGLSDIRATLASRTEIHAANQFASQALAMRAGMSLTKTWNAVNDSRTRDFGIVGAKSEFNHRVMNGQRVPLTARFAVPRINGSVELLFFPGDPNGSAGNIINCRCIQTYEEA